MVSELELANIWNAINRLQLQVDALEGNRPQAEYGATDCSVAGGDIEQCEPGVQSAGEALQEYRLWLSMEMSAIADSWQYQWFGIGSFSLLQLIRCYSYTFIFEERRRDAGCVEPPAD